MEKEPTYPRGTEVVYCPERDYWPMKDDKALIGVVCTPPGPMRSMYRIEVFCRQWCHLMTMPREGETQRFYRHVSADKVKSPEDWLIWKEERRADMVMRAALSGRVCSTHSENYDEMLEGIYKRSQVPKETP